MIEVPEKKNGRIAARALIEAFAQGTPVTAFLARFYGYTHPSQLEQDIETWRGEITDLVNNHETQLQKHEEALYPSAELTGLSAKIAVYLVKASADGLSNDDQDFDDLFEEFSDHEKTEVREAVYQLQNFGLVEIDQFLNSEGYLRYTDNLFFQLDHQVMGFNTIEDAITIAEMMLDDDRYGDIPTLHQELGWEKRRLR